MLKRITPILVDKEPKKLVGKDKVNMEVGKLDLAIMERRKGQALHIT